MSAVALLLVGGCDCGGAGLQSGRPVISVQVTALDFGAIPEATREVRGLQIDNPGLKTLEITATIEEGSPDFAVVGAQLSVPPSQSAQLEVAFTPADEGEDSAVLLLTSNDPLEPELRVDLHGGPIQALLVADPDPVVVVGDQPLETVGVTLRNDGMAHLDLRSVGVDPLGSPDFSVRATGIPTALPYRQSLTVQVDYARSTNPDQGRMVILSNDAAGEQKVVPLIPAPVALCADGIDNDGDGLTDFPDDPGCLDAVDNDEQDPPECIDDATQPCGVSEGSCVAGTRTCAGGQWGPCEGAAGPGTETCNGEDDDCDGTTDEGISAPCGAGACAGTSTCVEDAGVAGGEWGPCVVPGASAETCNGVDDDCDGQTDENLQQACTVNACVGTETCLGGGPNDWSVCQPDTVNTETCNGVDDDCDGQTDEGLGAPTCTINGCAGTRACQGSGGWSSCNPDFVDPESCNGIDDDCDGATDEDVAPQACTTTAGCTGTRSCPLNGDGQWGACQPDTTAPELCDGVDNDCDGQTDEAFPSLDTLCSVGIGECSTDGIVVCNLAETGTECSASPGTPGTEICNGLDDDCDTFDDDGLGPVPSVNQNGACAGNQDICMGSAGYQPDPGNHTPTTELCNGVDDDCDTATDEAFPTLGAACSVGAGECARSGNVVCDAALTGVECDATPGGPISELCNGLDDDCDGGTDETFPTLGAACTSGTGECARSGSFVCDAALTGVECDATPGTPGTEICNTLDDDCDGSTDEGGVCGACDPDGTYSIIAGGPTLSYSCCGGLVGVTVSSFTLANDGALATSAPSDPVPMIGGATSCNGGSFDDQGSIAGGCTEIYRVAGTFTDANTWTGTYSVTFVGSQCDCFGGLLGAPCVSQSWPITAQKP
ncbi:MAG: MopE-related protein [Deltaproteobacteria bacterium]|nr:MopE-related protein [Deltaproteobacteria bacterium]